MLALRHDVVKTIRDHLSDEGFLEIETPILTRSTPEGARDFLVPSRLVRGSWYALPQSPQLFKQLLIMGGAERYFQIARCFRDEDFRADRQPEFTQLDLEMGFVDEEDVIATIDPLLKRVLALGGIEVATPVERIAYDEAMLRYGSDRPDRRLGLEINDLTEVFRGLGVQGLRRARSESRRRGPRAQGGRRVAAQPLRRAHRRRRRSSARRAWPGRSSRAAAGARRSRSSSARTRSRAATRRSARRRATRS